MEIVQEPGDKADDQQEAMDQVRQIGPGPYEASVVRRYEQAWKMALSSHCGAQKGQVGEEEEQIKPVIIIGE